MDKIKKELIMWTKLDNVDWIFLKRKKKKIPKVGNPLEATMLSIGEKPLKPHQFFPSMAKSCNPAFQEDHYHGKICFVCVSNQIPNNSLISAK